MSVKIFPLKMKIIKLRFTWHFIDLHKLPKRLNFRSKPAYEIPTPYTTQANDT